VNNARVLRTFNWNNQRRLLLKISRLTQLQNAERVTRPPS